MRECRVVSFSSDSAWTTAMATQKTLVLPLLVVCVALQVLAEDKAPEAASASSTSEEESLRSERSYYKPYPSPGAVPISYSLPAIASYASPGTPIISLPASALSGLFSSAPYAAPASATLLGAPALSSLLAYVAPAPHAPAVYSLPALSPPAAYSLPAPSPPAAYPASIPPKYSVPAPSPPAAYSLPAPSPPAAYSIPPPSPPAVYAPPAPSPPAVYAPPAPIPPAAYAPPAPSPPAGYGPAPPAPYGALPPAYAPAPPAPGPHGSYRTFLVADKPVTAVHDGYGGGPGGGAYGGVAYGASSGAYSGYGASAGYGAPAPVPTTGSAASVHSVKGGKELIPLHPLRLGLCFYKADTVPIKELLHAHYKKEHPKY